MIIEMSLGKLLRLFIFNKVSKYGNPPGLLCGSKDASCVSDLPSERNSAAALIVEPPVADMIKTLPAPLRFGSSETVA